MVKQRNSVFWLAIEEHLVQLLVKKKKKHSWLGMLVLNECLLATIRLSPLLAGSEEQLFFPTLVNY